MQASENLHTTRLTHRNKIQPRMATDSTDDNPPRQHQTSPQRGPISDHVTPIARGAGALAVRLPFDGADAGWAARDLDLADHR
jgi:hypothetical protein